MLASTTMDVWAGLWHPQPASIPMGGVSKAATSLYTELTTSLALVKLAYTLYTPKYANPAKGSFALSVSQSMVSNSAV